MATDCRAAASQALVDGAGDHRLVGGHRVRMVRLLHLRQPRAGHLQGVLRRARPDPGADRRACLVRRRLRLPAAWRADLRRGRRPPRPQGRVPRHRQPDGRSDLPDRLPPDLCAGGLPRADPAHHLRILQGIALGGEYGGAAIYVAEHAPNNKRGASTGWIQSSASFGLLAALAGDRRHAHALGEDAFAAWGWRIPFLVSAVLLAISVWMRAKLAESPEFAKLREEGESPRRRCARRSATRRTEARADRLLRHHVRPGRGLVLHLFLHAGVPRKVARALPSQTKDLLLIVMTVVSAPLYVYFGWLSDRLGRKPVMIGGMLLALLLYFPASHWIADAANPRWSPRSARRRSSSTPIPATCSVQFDPSAPPSSSAPATSPRARWSPRAFPSPRSPSADGAHAWSSAPRRCRSPAARASRPRPQGAQGEDRPMRSGPSCRRGYPKGADPAAPT
jgi:hypothetical protein